MRYIDRTNCKKLSDRGADSDVKSIGKLSRMATKIAEQKKLAVLKNKDRIFGGVYYRVIRECGLGGVCERTFKSLEEVDKYLKSIQ